jgi:putative transcriptional regulator
MKTNIAQLRKEMGMTQEELASKTGVTRQTIIALEQNRYNPSLGLAYEITKELKQRHIEDVFDLTP